MPSKRNGLSVYDISILIVLYCFFRMVLFAISCLIEYLFCAALPYMLSYYAFKCVYHVSMFIYTKDSVPTSSLGAVAFENFNVNCTYADTVLESFMNVDEAASGTESDIWTTITLETSVTETGGAEYSFDIDTETDVDDEDNIISDIIRLYSEIPDPIEEVEKVAEVGEVAEVAGEPNATDVTNAALQAQAVVSEPEVLTKPEPKCISKRFSCYSGVDINHILANIDYLDPRDIEFIFDDFLDPSKPIPEEYFNFPEPPTHLPEIYYSERNSLAITSI